MLLMSSACWPSVTGLQVNLQSADADLAAAPSWPDKVQKTRNDLQAYFDGIDCGNVAVFSDICDSVTDLGRDAVLAVFDALRDAVAWMKNLIQTVTDAIINAMPQPVRAVAEFVRDFLATVSDVLSALASGPRRRSPHCTAASAA